MDCAIAKCLHWMLILTTLGYIFTCFAGYEGKECILTFEYLWASISFYLPVSEAYVFPVELKCSKLPLCCSRWVLRDKQAYFSFGMAPGWWKHQNRMMTSECRGTFQKKTAHHWSKCMHVCKCVYTSVCVCALTKLFNLSQSLTLEWLWHLIVCRLKVTSLWGFSASVWLHPLC